LKQPIIAISLGHSSTATSDIEASGDITGEALNIAIAFRTSTDDALYDPLRYVYWGWHKFSKVLLGQRGGERGTDEHWQEEWQQH